VGGEFLYVPDRPVQPPISDYYTTIPREIRVPVIACIMVAIAQLPVSKHCPRF